MMAGTPTGSAAPEGTWAPAGRALWWLPWSRHSNGEPMPDRAALIEAQIPGLRRFARALLRGDREAADDLVQDTLERALSYWNLRRNQGNLRGWLYTILYNRFLSDQHRVRRKGPHDVLTQETELPGIDGGQHSVLEHRDLLRAFATLSEEQRAVLLLVVPSRFVLEFDWRGLRLDEDTWSGSKVNRLIGEFVGQALPSVHFAHGDLT